VLLQAVGEFFDLFVTTKEEVGLVWLKGAKAREWVLDLSWSRHG